jgi:hypothetical protein
VPAKTANIYMIPHLIVNIMLLIFAMHIAELKRSRYCCSSTLTKIAREQIKM